MAACRLWRARKCALQKEAGLYGPSAEAEEGGNEALPRLEDQGMAAQTHAAFMSLLSNLIDGHQDAGAYEDACRALLGQQSGSAAVHQRSVTGSCQHEAGLHSSWMAQAGVCWT